MIQTVTASPQTFQNQRTTGLWHSGAVLCGSLVSSKGMNPDIKTLFEGVDAEVIQTGAATTVGALCTDSRRVSPGALFFALGGSRTDGNLYIDEAVFRGAAAVVSETAPTHLPAKVTVIRVANARRTLAEVAARFYGHPEASLGMIGVTGTNGKTTITTLIRHMLEGANRRTGLLGTVAYVMGRRSLPAARTTPESSELFSMLSQMVSEGCTEAVMEVSSHGIDQNRVWAIPFKVAAFTNLTQDHIDYHKTMEAYFDAKSRLFDGRNGCAPEIAVINIDDACGRRLANALPQSVKVVRFGESLAADFRADALSMSESSTRFTLVSPEGTFVVESPLLGRYNVSNVLCAIACVHAAGLSVDEAVKSLKSFTGVPGRMEKVDCGQDFNVLVDYAHTPDALHNALSMLRPITRGRVLVVFGCGGNRDRLKRPLMTRAVQAEADEAWATADNPRNETVAGIFDDMKGGVIRPDAIHWVEDRRRAIHLALSAAKSGDSVLIAGKGHETYQEFSDTVATFDDRVVARELLWLRQSSGIWDGKGAGR
ncbi:MAG TPA: UDP-N-acetylmuramoyl-L-alanyl-D-glutamate--2,6-diaminopimelate ligase [Opitutales bacterium]|nr:UDP-N-acetylmuramoyl-L-alanyl-D-glutamate--2,6-diaminopimelate ligase [Opitutales bacterium]